MVALKVSSVMLETASSSISSIKEAFELGRNQLELSNIPEEQTPKMNVRQGIDPSHIILVKAELTKPPGDESSRDIQVKGAFISYAREDFAAALRLYEDLKPRTDLRLRLDKKNLLPGQTWNLEIRKAIMNSRYFIPLFSSTSVQKRGYVQKEFRLALEVFDEFPEGEIFAIPARLDNCEIPYEKFRSIERVDLFPDWNEGVQRLLRTIEIH
jgi:hypothetical protein